MSRTFKEVFEDALSCETEEQAAAWMEKEIQRHVNDHGQSPEEARNIISQNLGYFAGYYDDATAKKIDRLFGATHPIFGGSDYHTTVSAEEAFAAGAALADKAKS